MNMQKGIEKMTISQAKKTVLDAFEARTDDWKYVDFEKAIVDAIGKGNYQDGKLAILLADQDGRWPKTVERYIRTNYASFGNVPVELIKIASRFDLKS